MLATFAISIVDNLCLPQQNNGTQSNQQDAIRIKFRDHSRLFRHSLKKTGCCREVILVVGDAQKRCSGRCRCREVQV